MLAVKLRMAAEAIGCASRKAFCARFREVNPATQCDLERLNKWMQGRSLPRASSVYADLAAVIGSTKPGSWIAGCSVEEFAAELAACTGAQAPAVPDIPARRAEPRPTGLFGGTAGLAGAFAAYSLAWSPRYRGSLIRGSLRLQPDGRGRLVATYAENLLGRLVQLDGEIQIGRLSMDFTLREPEGGAPLFLTLHVPAPPASILVGVMSGATFISHEALPSATRIVFIRVPDSAALDATNRYLAPEEGAIAADLVALGLVLGQPERMDASMRAILGPVPAQVSALEQAGLADIMDEEYFNDGAAHDLPAPPGAPP
ncbi:hypothetical protein [Muricoccus radiodurans]|uniref:hypothetical protein n=1 Tax=Muricoccus radiodurans TaxID=2231721 RepID=UPI003CF5C74F